MIQSLPPDIADLVRQQMATGEYQSEEEVLRRAMRALEENRHAVVYDDPETLAGVQRGLDEMRAGLGRPFEAFDAEWSKTKKNQPDG